MNGKLYGIAMFIAEVALLDYAAAAVQFRGNVI